MDTEIRSHYHPHLLGESATYPIEPRYGTLAALLRLAGMSPQPLSRLARAPHHGPLGRVQLPFLG